jgi:mevalonate kinase
MASITASAPAKLMLYGEHAVVYGAPCIVTAVDLRVRVTVTPRADEQVSVATPALTAPYTTTLAAVAGGDPTPQETSFVLAALRGFWAATGGAFGVEIVTASDFTQAYGLGSSSAVTVATLAALAAALARPLSPAQLFTLGYRAVLDVQGGLGSGFDIATALYGGTLYFVTGGKVIQPLDVPELPLVIGYSGVKARTTVYGRQVAGLRAAFPGLVGGAMDLIGGVVDAAREALLASDYASAGRLMDFNQGLLDALGVGTPALNRLIEAARGAGAYGAKLSGAGGGDCMFALVDEAHRGDVEAALANTGLPGAEVVRVRNDAPGVRVEREPNPRPLP